MEANLDIKKKHVIVSVNPQIYPLDVVMSAAYLFTDDCYVLVDGDPKEEIIVELRPKKGDPEIYGRKFNNELINYANYAIRTLKNEKMRESLLQRVMLTNSETYEPDEYHDDMSEIEDSKTEDSDVDKPWFDDPEGIAVPWEEKYGKDKGE